MSCEGPRHTEIYAWTCLGCSQFVHRRVANNKKYSLTKASAFVIVTFDIVLPFQVRLKTRIMLDTESWAWVEMTQAFQPNTKLEQKGLNGQTHKLTFPSLFITWII